MPDGFLVKIVAMGTKTRSYIGMKKITAMLIKDLSEAGGMSKPDPIDLSMVVPCLVKKVEDCASTKP